MDNNYVKLDISDYNQLIANAYKVEHYTAENLKLKEEKLKLEEEVSILNSIVDDRLANEECMTDPSEDDCLDVDEFKVTEDDWKRLSAYLEIQQKDIEMLCSIVFSLQAKK